MDIIHAEKMTDLHSLGRSEGTYALLYTGRLTWSEAAGTWQAYGAEVHLMDGRRMLAICKLEVPQHSAQERGTTVAQEMTPWVETLRHVATASDLRDRISSAERMMGELKEELQWEDLPSELLIQSLSALCTSEDALVVQTEFGSVKPLRGVHYVRMLEVATERYQRAVEKELRLALAHAPSLEDSPIHPAWEQKPPFADTPGASTAQTVAQELLTAWKSLNRFRDPLITWAVQSAGVTKSAVQRTSGASRTTIDRLLPNNS